MRTVEVDITRQDLRDEFKQWGIPKGDYEITWEDTKEYAGRALGAKVEFLRNGNWQYISCFKFPSRAHNLRQCLLLIQRLRIAEKFGVQYAGLTSSKEITTVKTDTRSEGQLLGDAYDYLGISPEDPTELIKDIFRKKAMYCHPDPGKGGSDEKFKRLNEAYERIMKSRGANGAAQQQS